MTRSVTIYMINVINYDVPVSFLIFCIFVKETLEKNNCFYCVGTEYHLKSELP